MKIYMMASEDELQLPLAVANSPAELAKMAGVQEEAIMCGLSRKSKKYVKVVIDNEEGDRE